MFVFECSISGIIIDFYFVRVIGILFKYTIIGRTYTYTVKHLKIQHQIYLCGTSIVKTVVKT